MGLVMQATGGLVQQGIAKMGADGSISTFVLLSAFVLYFS